MTRLRRLVLFAFGVIAIALPALRIASNLGWLVFKMPTLVVDVILILVGATCLYYALGGKWFTTAVNFFRTDRADIKIRFASEPRYCVRRNGRYSFRFGIHNDGDRSEARNAQLWLVAATKPRAHVRYELPFQVARDGSEWTISGYAHGPAVMPLDPVSINPKDETLFEPMRTWTSSEGQHMVGRIDTKPDGDRYCWPIEADETWRLKYEARAANADTATIEVRVYVANGAVRVEKIMV